MTALLLFSLLTFVFAPQIALANHQTGANIKQCDAASILGIKSWNQYLKCDSANGEAIADFHLPGDIWPVLLAVFEILTRVAVYLAVGVIIYAGFKFTIAQGSPEKIQEAKTIIQDALIGLVIAIMATAIIGFVGNSLI